MAKTLEFTVTGQIIAMTSGRPVVADSRNILYAHFTFVGWDDVGTKTAVFVGPSSTAYNVVLDNDACLVPWEVIKTPLFTVSVFGGDLITVTEATVPVSSSGYKDGVTPPAPTPDVYNQMITAFDAAKAQTAADVQTTTQKAAEASGSAASALTDSQSAAANKSATDTNKAATDQSALDAQQSAVAATEQSLLSKYYADQAQSIVSNMPMRYYRAAVEAMSSITNPHQGDLCYVTDFAAAKTQLYVYDTTDMDADNNNPEWVFLGWLEFASLDRATLLSILQLAPVALSGSYNDLTNKPSWHRAPITLDNTADTLVWDYSLSDTAIVTLTTDKDITINNLYAGAEGVIQVYGTGALTIPDSQKSATFGMLTPLADQEHATYSFYSRDGVNLDWIMMPFKGASI